MKTTGIKMLSKPLCWSTCKNASLRMCMTTVWMQKHYLYHNARTRSLKSKYKKISKTFFDKNNFINGNSSKKIQHICNPFFVGIWSNILYLNAIFTADQWNNTYISNYILLYESKQTLINLKEVWSHYW